MRRFLKERRLLVGVIALVAIGAGVALAVIIGQARINQNSAQTEEVPPPTVVSVALIDPDTQDCTDPQLTYEVVSSGQVFTDSVVDIDSGTNVAATGSLAVCIRNQSGVFLAISATSENVLSGELAGCPDQFEAAANDATCDPATGGELGGGELWISYLEVPGAGYSDPGVQGFCATGGPTPLVEAGTASDFASIDPGFRCAYIVSLRGNPAITDYSASSTDTIQFDIVFTADDGT